jgi:hypothetical protein
LGNLTLVTPKFNQPVSNGPWASKKLEFVTQSSLQLNVAGGQTVRGRGGRPGRENWDVESISSVRMFSRKWHAGLGLPGDADVEWPRRHGLFEPIV